MPAGQGRSLRATEQSSEFYLFALAFTQYGAVLFLRGLLAITFPPLPMRCLVTGASGFVGRPLCAELVNRGFTVRTALRSAAAEMADFPSVSVGAICATTDWRMALDEVDVVVHLAARVHVMHDTALDPLTAFRATNVSATLNLARQALACGVSRFVFVSSVKVNGEYTSAGHAFSETDTPNPQDAYAVSKHEAEMGLRQLAAGTCMQLVIIRPPLVYGSGVKANFAALMRAVQRGWPLPLGAVHNRRSLVALDNLLDFIVTCVSHPQAANQTFFVSDGHDLSTADLVRGLARGVGMSARLVPVPVWALRAGAALLGQGGAVQRLCDNLQVDISKAHQVLGWTPPVSVDEGLRRAVCGMPES